MDTDPTQGVPHEHAVSFEDQWTPPAQAPLTNAPILRFIMKCSGGLIADVSQAAQAAVVFIILMVLLSLIVLFRGGDSTTDWQPEAYAENEQFLPVLP